MNNHIQHIEISNFKSIKDLKIDGCKKINVLVGFPNAGKSNILEALGLFGIFEFSDQKKKLSDFVRFEKLNELFFEGNSSKLIDVKTNESYLNFSIDDKGLLNIISAEYAGEKYDFDYYIKRKLIFNENEEIENLIADRDTTHNKIKKYSFKESIVNKPSEKDYIHLNYPFGKNLSQIISSKPEIRAEINRFFIQNNLKLLIEKGTNELKIFKEYQDGTVFTLPYNMIADTLQRLIFYKTAIMSNHNSVLLFEEPEAHCFEPYILEFTNEVKYNENNNQFFIVTHSDFIIQELLRDEESKNNTQIFLVNNVDGETKIKKLDAEKNEEVYEYGMNVFFNFENLWENN